MSTLFPSETDASGPPEEVRLHNKRMYNYILLCHMLFPWLNMDVCVEDRKILKKEEEQWRREWRRGEWRRDGTLR